MCNQAYDDSNKKAFEREFSDTNKMSAVLRIGDPFHHHHLNHHGGRPSLKHSSSPPSTAYQGQLQQEQQQDKSLDEVGAETFGSSSASDFKRSEISAFTNPTAPASLNSSGAPNLTLITKKKRAANLKRYVDGSTGQAQNVGTTYTDVSYKESSFRKKREKLGPQIMLFHLRIRTYKNN